VPETTVYEVQGEIYDVEEKMSQIARSVAEQGKLSFTELLLRCRVRAEMIVTFMALLELIKLGQVLVVQEGNFTDITILARSPEGSETHASDEPSARA
jgi:segregation and condensation protein A